MHSEERLTLKKEVDEFLHAIEDNVKVDDIPEHWIEEAEHMEEEAHEEMDNWDEYEE